MDRKAALIRARLLRAGLWTFTVVNAAWLALIVLVHALPLPERGGGWSVEIHYRDGRPAHVFLAPDDKWRLEVALDRVDPKLVDALVALEDRRFWSHPGVDAIAVVRAAWSNAVHLRRVSGGSTITMQLARLLEPRPRTVRSKLIEMFRALQLDARLSKREILEAYLARTPYGGNLEGVESAAWAYFGHGAAHLSPLEIATLLAVPQGPRRYAPSEANAERLRARRDAILGKLLAAGVFDADDAGAALADAADQPPPARLRPMPRQAPHAASWLRARYPGHTRVRTTLDAGAQTLVERKLALHAPELRSKRAHNAAVVVVDHRTREVVALAGNLDFGDAAHGGQIGMFHRPRSPGSTLKPVLYALAIDRGLALPEYLVADVPGEYGTYRPRNFDNDWAGLVTLREALSKSLNLPFVDLLNRFGVEAFVAELQRLGVASSRATPGELGLSLIVGSAELTPLELAGIYATLAQDGVHRPLRFRPDEAPGAAVRIFGAAAAFLTREALAQKDRPDFPRRRINPAAPRDIHWKTGTSFGFRDAWAIGSGPAHTAVVWTGNVDRAPSADLVGSEAAGPLLFDVLEGIADRARTAGRATPPEDLIEVEVCAYSGHVPGDACERRASARASVHAVPTTPCPYHQAYDVDRDGRAVLPACRGAGASYERRTFVVLPSAVTAFLAERHRAVPAAPAFADGCAPEGGPPGIAPPVLITPSEGQVVTLIPGLPARQQVIGFAASTRAATLSWFVDGALIGTAPASERVYWVPVPGTHEVVVSDEAGRKARRRLIVR